MAGVSVTGHGILTPGVTGAPENVSSTFTNMNVQLWGWNTNTLAPIKIGADDNGSLLTAIAAGQGGGIVPVSGTASSAGDNTLITPAAGTRIRLYYFSLSADASNSAPVVAALRLGAGAPMYTESLVPGAIFARNIGAGEFYAQRNINDALILNLSAAQTVYWSIERVEV